MWYVVYFVCFLQAKEGALVVCVRFNAEARQVCYLTTSYIQDTRIDVCTFHELVYTYSGTSDEGHSLLRARYKK